MSKYLIDTDVKPAQCPRCGEVVLLAKVGGSDVAAEPTPLDRQAVVRELLSDRPVWALKGKRLHYGTAEIVARAETLLAGHSGCAKAMDAKPLKPVTAGPQRASASFGQHRAGQRPQRALAGAQGPSKAAPHVNPLPSKPCGWMTNGGACGKQARPYPCGWRCQEHITGNKRESG